MKDGVTILIYTFPQPGDETAAFAKIVASIERTWEHVGQLKTVIVASHRFAAVVVRLIVKETPDGKRTWMVEFSNRKELTEVPATGEAATIKATRLNPPSTHTVLKKRNTVNGSGGPARIAIANIAFNRLKML